MSAGYKKFETTIFSINRDNKGVTEMGRKSAHWAGFDVLATGVMILLFHCFGTKVLLSDKLYTTERGLARKGATVRKNHEGMVSRPGEEFLSV